MVMITMPLLTVCDEDPALFSLRPLEVVQSPRLALSTPDASGLMQGCFVGQSRGAGKKWPTEGSACPGPSLLGADVAA